MSSNSHNSPLQQILMTMEIHLQWFEARKKFDGEHVKQILGTRTIDMSNEEIDLIICRMKKDQEDVLSLGKGEVEGMVLKHIKDQGISVDSIYQFKNMWRETGSPEFAATLFFSFC